MRAHGAARPAHKRAEVVALVCHLAGNKSDLAESVILGEHARESNFFFSFLFLFFLLPVATLCKWPRRQHLATRTKRACRSLRKRKGLAARPPAHTRTHFSLHPPEPGFVPPTPPLSPNSSRPLPSPPFPRAAPAFVSSRGRGAAQSRGPAPGRAPRGCARGRPGTPGSPQGAAEGQRGSPAAGSPGGWKAAGRLPPLSPSPRRRRADKGAGRGGEAKLGAGPAGRGLRAPRRLCQSVSHVGGAAAAPTPPPMPTGAARPRDTPGEPVGKVSGAADPL